MGCTCSTSSKRPLPTIYLDGESFFTTVKAYRRTHCVGENFRPSGKDHRLHGRYRLQRLRRQLSNRSWLSIISTHVVLSTSSWQRQHREHQLWHGCDPRLRQRIVCFKASTALQSMLMIASRTIRPSSDVPGGSRQNILSWHIPLCMWV